LALVFRAQPFALRGVVAALLIALSLALLPIAQWAATARADTPQLKAVFISAPTHELTDSNLADSEAMAQQAEAAGYDVRRVFHPYATWDNVLANIQGASLVVYMGHGYGWPSPYTSKMMEDRQNGMGLNPYPGAAKNERTYYGAKPIRNNIHLAPHAVVILNHLCYAAGNGESGMAIPNQDVASQRADNMANGWLYAGADAVFATTWTQSVNFPLALATTNQTMDQIFMTPSPWIGSPAGFIGWNDVRLDSERTPGATVHLDPHQQQGWYRALTGKMDATTADFRSGAGSTGGGGATDPNAPPQITSLSAGLGSTLAPTDPPSFHPNGDGLDEEIVLAHSVTKATNLDVAVRNSHGTLVRSFSVWSPLGASTSRWSGKNDAGNIVPDDLYTLTYTPRDTANRIGTPVSIDIALLTAIKLGKPSVPGFYAADGDGLAKSAKFNVTLNQPAVLDWVITDGEGNSVRTVRTNSSLPTGPTSFVWDGKADGGSFVPDGWYKSVVEATTALGTYSQERKVYVGAFRITPSISSPARGGKLLLTMISGEKMSGPVTVTIEQPGLAPWSVTAAHPDTLRYKAALTLKSGGNAGTLVLTVSGNDKNGAYQESELQLVLR
jgi:flagellar hook assembly protein FlgD